MPLVSNWWEVADDKGKPLNPLYAGDSISNYGIHNQILQNTLQILQSSKGCRWEVTDDTKKPLRANPFYGSVTTFQITYFTTIFHDQLLQSHFAHICHKKTGFEVVVQSSSEAH